ncbi:hypothetical protein [Pseudomonas putida]|uniref:DNA alkylation repair protein n=1 Tax=Pseudomonas putida TaxID=303 RepID=A0A1Q9R6T2_PSEPU|nr:hypothetical protein [Pseudomonas putida]OLS63129.1 hypothetical protein PSEMO_20650 [Pseudomonas putida]
MSENRKALIDQGAMATRNLAECLAVDQRVLAASVAAQVDRSLAEALQEAAESSRTLGISKKIATIGLALGQWLEATPAPSRDADLLFSHPSDTVRGWAAFANAWALRDSDIGEALQGQLRFATDEHFGVREWAWLALRPQLVTELERSLALLQRHHRDNDPLIRRFSIEILRPRGVWCEHIARLKSEPEIAEALLVPLLAEADKYPQDSVANWLNDASKTRPDWVLQLFERYPPECKASTRIFTRATRSLPVNA